MNVTEAIAKPRHVTQSAVDKAMAMIAEDAPITVLFVVAVFIDLAEDARESAEEYEADGFNLSAKHIHDIAEKYELSAKALSKIWKEE